MKKLLEEKINFFNFSGNLVSLDPLLNDLLRNDMMTNRNFDNGYMCFDVMFIYAGNTFLTLQYTTIICI